VSRCLGSSAILLSDGKDAAAIIVKCPFPKNGNGETDVLIIR
jgi:hypothetical protein